MSRDLEARATASDEKGSFFFFPTPFGREGLPLSWKIERLFPSLKVPPDGRNVLHVFRENPPPL